MSETERINVLERRVSELEKKCRKNNDMVERILPELIKRVEDLMARLDRLQEERRRIDESNRLLCERILKKLPPIPNDDECTDHACNN